MTNCPEADFDFYGRRSIVLHILQTLQDYFPEPRHASKDAAERTGRSSGLHEDDHQAQLGEWVAYVLFRTNIPISTILFALRLLRRVAILRSSPPPAQQTPNIHSPLKSSPSSPTSSCGRSSFSGSTSSSATYSSPPSSPGSPPNPWSHPFTKGYGVVSPLPTSPALTPAHVLLNLPPPPMEFSPTRFIISSLILANFHHSDSGYAFEAWSLACRHLFSVRELEQSVLRLLGELGWKLRHSEDWVWEGSVECREEIERWERADKQDQEERERRNKEQERETLGDEGKMKQPTSVKEIGRQTAELLRCHHPSFSASSAYSSKHPNPCPSQRNWLARISSRKARPTTDQKTCV